MLWCSRTSRTLGVSLALVLACGTDHGSGTQIPSGGTESQGEGGAPPSDGGDSGLDPSQLLSNWGPMFIAGSDTAGGSGGTTQEGSVSVLSLRIEPQDALLNVSAGEAATQPFTTFGRLSTDPDTEVELTEFSVFYVPDRYLIGGFPSDGTALFSTRLPSALDDPAQRGGKLTVQAQTANSDGTLTTVTTQLTVQLNAVQIPGTDTPEATPSLPAQPLSHFENLPTSSSPPVIYYPNSGTLLPPNLGQLEVHFQRGDAANQLFNVKFESAYSNLNYLTRCYSDPDEFEANACVLTVEGDEFQQLAASNQGQGTVNLTVQGTDEAGALGESTPIQIEFAEERMDGAVYYWTATDPESIVRFEFGSGLSAPETFLAPNSVPGNGTTCIGCHALSRRGDKMFFSLGSSADGRLVYVDDMSTPSDDTEFFAYNGAQQSGENRVLTGSFSPEGDQFVAVAPVNDAEDDTQLFFHSGVDGTRTGSVQLPYIPSHPDWSPLGNAIAMTSIEGTNGQTISFLGGGIEMITQQAGAWDGANPVSLVPATAGKNRFNPTFFPDGSLLLYTEVDQATYSGTRASSCEGTDPTGSGRFCNGYSDPGAKTWAIAAEAGGSPVFLANAAAPGLADALFPPPQVGVGSGDLMDTFPKPTPFQIRHRDRTLGWFTVSSQRRAGLRKFFPNSSVVGDPASQALLWMFALDPAEILSGEDGSRPGFFLPFQNLTTSNHMAQWTQRIVSDSPRPAPPEAVPPPAAPPPPPPPAVLY